MNSTQEIFAAMRNAVERQGGRVAQSQVPDGVPVVPRRIVRTMRRICTRQSVRPRWGAGAALPTSDLE